MPSFASESDEAADGGPSSLTVSSSSSGPSALRSVSLPDGAYTVYAGLPRHYRALSVKGSSPAGGASIVLAKPAEDISQRFVLERLGKGTYTIRAVVSGKYLTDVKGKVVQRTRPAKGVSRSMRWVLVTDGQGVMLRNVASGRFMALSSKKAAAGSALRTASRKAAAKHPFYLARRALAVPEGMYAIRTHEKRFWLSPKGYDAERGEGLCLSASKSSNYERYVLEYAGNGWYRIVSALSDLAIQSGKVDKTGHEPVRMATRANRGRQFWKPEITDNGIVFRNKATGHALEYAGKAAKKGAKVRAGKLTGKARQEWNLVNASLDLTSDWGLASVIYTMPASRGSEIYVSAKGTGYRMSAKGERRLRNALDQARWHGYTVSFAMMDLQTGVTITSGADSSVHGASTFKAAYVTYIYEDLLEPGWVSNSSVYSLMDQAVGASSNEAYAALRNQFGSSGFRSWLNDASLGWLASEWYPRLTARQLARVWAKIRAYEVSGGSYVSQWHKMFGRSANSCIREGIGSWEWVYSKSGWYPRFEGYAALNDAGIVWDENDRAYLLAILTDANCNSDHWILQEIARAADALHWEMP